MWHLRDAVELVLVTGAGRPAPQAQRVPAPRSSTSAATAAPRRSSWRPRSTRTRPRTRSARPRGRTQGRDMKTVGPDEGEGAGASQSAPHPVEPIGPGGRAAPLRRGRPRPGGPQRLRDPAAGRGAGRGRRLRREHGPGGHRPGGDQVRRLVLRGAGVWPVGAQCVRPGCSAAAGRGDRRGGHAGCARRPGVDASSLVLISPPVFPNASVAQMVTVQGSGPIEGDFVARRDGRNEESFSKPDHFASPFVPLREHRPPGTFSSIANGKYDRPERLSNRDRASSWSGGEGLERPASGRS